MIAALLLGLACFTLGGAVAMTAYALGAILVVLHPRSTGPQTRKYVVVVAWTSTAAAGFALTTAGLVISAMSHG
jgi:hypothetical protein